MADSGFTIPKSRFILIWNLESVMRHGGFQIHHSQIQIHPHLESGVCYLEFPGRAHGAEIRRWSILTARPQVPAGQAWVVHSVAVGAENRIPARGGRAARPRLAGLGVRVGPDS